jgi:hypothetical protein
MQAVQHQQVVETVRVLQTLLSMGMWLPAWSSRQQWKLRTHVSWAVQTELVPLSAACSHVRWLHSRLSELRPVYLLCQRKPHFGIAHWLVCGRSPPSH